MIDLHCHSTYSDGTYTPQDIIDLAISLELHQLSITDHNCVDGSLEALKIIDEQGLDLDFVIGCELSCEYHQREVHLLGYFAKDNFIKGPLEQFIIKNQEDKIRSQLLMIDRLRQLGMDISYQEVVERFPHTVINRVHISRILMEKGYVHDVSEAFERYLGNQAPCFVQKKCLPLSYGIDMIHQAHGIAILAHPFQYVQDHMEDFLKDALKLPLDGIEVIHSSHTLSQQEQLIKLCQKQHLRMTGGSDFHGENKPNIALGSQHVDDRYKIIF